jgi:DNA polymerase I-like protein with 3'-5' exonuclease and polymerase domains
MGPLSQGFKPFDAMAERMYGPEYTQDQRQGMKTQTYATLYGGGIKRLQDLFSLSYEDAKKRRTDWFDAYPNILDWSPATP